MAKTRYNFDKAIPDSVNKNAPIKDIRQDFRITRCCGNCRHFFYTGEKSRKGFCKLPNPKATGNSRHVRADELLEMATERGWLPTHTVNVCSKHKSRDNTRSHYVIENWVGKKFNNVGDGGHCTDDKI